MHLRKSLFFIFCAVILVGAAASPVSAQNPIDTIGLEEVHIIRGEIENLKVTNLTRLSVTDPLVADILDATEDNVEIIGKDIGQTALFIWDEYGKRVVVIRVHSQDMGLVKKRIENLLKTAKIYEIDVDVNDKEGKVVVSGEVPEYKKDNFQAIVDRFDIDVIDLVEEEDLDDLVQLDMQITELNTTLTKSLGIDWFAIPSSESPTTENTGAGGFFNPFYAESIPSFDGSIEDFFKIGDFRRTSALVAQVNALLEEGKGRILSKPKLVVKSGEEAKFLVGGQIPIRTTTATDGSTQENVEFKEFGVGVTLTPTLIRNKVDIVLNVEISDIDRANRVGEDVAFTTRTASTHLNLDDRQMVVLAGLIRSSKGETLRRVPFASQIPIVGLLFRTRSTPTPDEDQEIVISITPTILAGKSRNSLLRRGLSQKGGGEVPAAMPAAPPRANSRPSTTLPYYSGIPKEMKEYVHAVQKRISESIVYPREAREYGWEGTVKLAMLILNDGTLAFATIKESSGYDIFDEYAVNTAKNVAPYSGFPANTDLQELSVTVPIVYSLKKN